SSLVADAACRCVLLLGGITAGMNAPFADSWRWDGSSWHALAPHPSARSDARMIYDPVTKQVMLFGGVSVLSPLGDTWLWAGRRWTQAVVNGPPRSAGWNTAYDGARRQLVVF